LVAGNVDRLVHDLGDQTDVTLQPPGRLADKILVARLEIGRNWPELPPIRRLRIQSRPRD
jgi:hypothetical protein